MQVRIGVQNAPKELVVDTEQSAEEVQDALVRALGEPNGVLTLRERADGRLVVVPAARVGYLEICEDERRSVGFGS